MLSLTYIVCFIIGFVLILVSFVLGEIFDFLHVGGHGPGPLSTSVLAMFLAGFGIGGYAAISLMHLAGYSSVLVAVGVGIALAGATYSVLRLLYTSGEGSSDFRLEEQAGVQAQVTVPIPAGGRGEVAFIAAQARQIASAVSADGNAIPKLRTVRIVRAIGDVVVVEEVKST